MDIPVYHHPKQDRAFPAQSVSTPHSSNMLSFPIVPSGTSSEWDVLVLSSVKAPLMPACFWNMPTLYFSVAFHSQSNHSSLSY